MYKLLIGLGAFIGGIAGAYIPSLWGDTDFLSVWSILLGTVDGIFGIFLGYALARHLDE